MKKLFIISAMLVTGFAHADCKWAHDEVARSEARLAADPALKPIFENRLATAKRHLTECLETDAKWAAEDARRAKLPAPRIGQRKQNINWGYPTSVRTVTTATGVVEFQHFPGGNALMYVNGILTSIQTN